MITQPKDMTEAQGLEIVHYLATIFNLTELRRRQTLVDRQIAMAYRQQNTVGLENLRAMERHLQCAVLLLTGL